MMGTRVRHLVEMQACLDMLKAAFNFRPLLLDVNDIRMNNTTNNDAFRNGSIYEGNSQRVFDWDEAARLIQWHKPDKAYAGLIETWRNTGGCIWQDRGIVRAADTYTFLASTWATPVLILDTVVVDCWLWDTETEWDDKTYYPVSALHILQGFKADGSS